MRTLSSCLLVLCLSTSGLLGCGSGTSTTEESTTDEQPPPDTSGDETAERPSLTTEECEAQGGSLVGDIGDGATQRPDYVCPSGQPPIGNVALGIEGSVCCPGTE